MSKQEHDAAVAVMREETSTFDKPWYRSCAEVIEESGLRNLKCLDICCGNGEFSIILRDRFDMDVTCADYIEHHLNKVAGDGFQTFKIDVDGDAEEVGAIAEQYKNQFDLVVNIAAIEHIFNSDNLLRFIHTVLKPGGQLVVNTPNISFIGHRLYSVFSGNRPFGEGHHVRFWDYRFLRTNLFLNGFSVVKDARKFYALPQDNMRRAFKGRDCLADFVARFFHVCGVLQKVSFFKNSCCDELTIVAKKEDVPVIGFDYITFKATIERYRSDERWPEVRARLKELEKRGWLAEHLYMSKLVKEL